MLFLFYSELYSGSCIKPWHCIRLVEKTSLISSFDFFSPRPDCINLGLVSHCLYYQPSVRGRQRPSGSLGDWFQIAPVIEANNWPSCGRPLNSQAEPKFDRGPQPAELVKIHLLLLSLSLFLSCVYHCKENCLVIGPVVSG